jgi:hypothetical protein
MGHFRLSLVSGFTGSGITGFDLSVLNDDGSRVFLSGLPNVSRNAVAATPLPPTWHLLLTASALRRPPFVFRAFLKIQSRFEMIAHGLQQRRTTP